MHGHCSEALRSVSFWMLFGTLLFSNLSSQVLNVHLMALLLSVGIVARTAASTVGTVNLVSMGGRISVGWLADRLGRGPAYTIALLCSIAGMASPVTYFPRQCGVGNGRVRGGIRTQ